MATTELTFPRIEVRPNPNKDWLATVILITKSEDDQKTSVTMDHVDEVVDRYRKKPEAGSCCPLYDYRD